MRQGAISAEPAQFSHVKPALHSTHLEVCGADDLLVLAEPLDERRRVPDDATLEADLLPLVALEILEQLRELGRHHLGRDARRRDVAHLTQSCKQQRADEAFSLKDKVWGKTDFFSTPIDQTSERKCVSRSSETYKGSVNGISP